MLDFELGHIGINGADPTDADRMAGLNNRIFSFENSVGNSSIMSSPSIEITKKPFWGKNGQIGIKANSIPRAMYYLKRRGVDFDESTTKYSKKGIMKAIYLQSEIGGFAIHLMQK